jgi:hypothetical protein
MTTIRTIPHDLRPGNIVSFYGGRFEIVSMPRESGSHRPEAYWPSDSIGPSDTVCVRGVCIEGEVKGYFRPGTEWNFQGNHRAAFSVET